MFGYYGINSKLHGRLNHKDHYTSRLTHKGHYTSRPKRKGIYNTSFQVGDEAGEKFARAVQPRIQKGETLFFT